MVRILHRMALEPISTREGDSELMLDVSLDTVKHELLDGRRARRPFTVKELEDLEEICGLHLNHLLLFMESVINQAQTQESVVFWNNVRHTFHCDS